MYGLTHSKNYLTFSIIKLENEKWIEMKETQVKSMTPNNLEELTEIFTRQNALNYFVSQNIIKQTLNFKMRNTEDCIALPEIAEELANEGTEIEAEDYNTYEEEKTVDENIRSTHDQASYSDN